MEIKPEFDNQYSYTVLDHGVTVRVDHHEIPRHTHVAIRFWTDEPCAEAVLMDSREAWLAQMFVNVDIDDGAGGRMYARAPLRGKAKMAADAADRALNSLSTWGRG